MKNFKLSILFVFLTIASTNVKSQVVIGSPQLEPAKAMALEVKTQAADANNVTASSLTPGGFGLPRVRLEGLNDLRPFIAINDSYWRDKATTKADKLHTGMMVYNMQDNATFKPGIYVWDGAQWVSQAAQAAPTNNVWLLDGNSNAANKFVGTTNANPLIFKANGTKRMEIASNGNITIGNKNETMTSTYMNLPVSSSSNVLHLVTDSEGKVYRQDFGENIKPINYITFELTCANPGANGDYIKNYDTKISASNYTMVVVGATLKDNNKDGGNIGLSVGDTSGTYNPYAVYAFNEDNTWRLRADYVGGGVASSTIKGTWVLYCLVIHNSLVNTLTGVTQTGVTISESSADINKIPAVLR
jgi:hypothetical protein